MTVRHITSAENVDAEGYLIDPTRVHHGAVRARRLASLAGPVDPLTHLNTDFPEHEVGICVIAAELTEGAPMVLDDDEHFARAVARPDDMCPRGFVDQGQRRSDWLRVLRQRRS